jgi:integrase
MPRLEHREARLIYTKQTRQSLDSEVGHWIRPILMFASATGCRRGEMLAWDWSELDLDVPSVSITRSLEQTKAGLRLKCPKNGRARIIYLPHTLVVALQEHRKNQDENRGGLIGIGLHSLRHSHGSELLSKGVPLPTVSKRLGHGSPHVTAKVYAHSFSADEIASARIWDEAVRSVLSTETPRQSCSLEPECSRL